MVERLCKEEEDSMRIRRKATGYPHGVLRSRTHELGSLTSVIDFDHKGRVREEGRT